MSTHSLAGGGPQADAAANALFPTNLTLHLEGFAQEALAQESARLGVSHEELASFSVLYYLADLDSGRIARRVPKAIFASAMDSRGPKATVDPGRPV